jgi:Gpi18-like mannosyltransferase
MIGSNKKRVRQWAQPALELVGILLLALVFRVAYLHASGHHWDLDLFEAWGKAAHETGLLTVYADQPRLDYPPFYITMMAAAFSIQEVLGHPSTITLLKIGPVLGDLGLVMLAYVIFRAQGWLRFAVPLFLACLPGVIATSAFWGQVDSLWVVFILLAIILLKESHFSLAWIFYAIALLTKFQAIVFLPVLGLYTLLMCGWRGAVRGVFWAGLSLLLGVLPFIAGSGLHETLRPYLDSVGRFPDLTRNALNLWMLGAVGAGLPIRSPNYPIQADNTPLVGFLTGREAGLVMLGLYVLLVLVVAFRQRNKERLFTWAGALYLGFFMLSTQMHERYLYPAVILAFFAIAEDRRMVWVALPLAVTFSYNIIAITTMPFVWLGVDLLYLTGEIGLFVALLNGFLLVVWTWFLLTPDQPAQLWARRAQTLLKATLVTMLAGLALSIVVPDQLPRMTALTTQFDNGARLLGYELSHDENLLNVDLFWSNSSPIRNDLAVFVHVLSDGERVAQDDQFPSVPTNRWALNEIVTTHHMIDASGLDLDTVSVVAGLFDVDTMQRAGAIQDGVQVPENWVRLERADGVPPT